MSGNNLAQTIQQANRVTAWLHSLTSAEEEALIDFASRSMLSDKIPEDMHDFSLLTDNTLANFIIYNAAVLKDTRDPSRGYASTFYRMEQVGANSLKWMLTNRKTFDVAWIISTNKAKIIKTTLEQILNNPYFKEIQIKFVNAKKQKYAEIEQKRNDFEQAKKELLNNAGDIDLFKEKVYFLASRRNEMELLNRIYNDLDILKANNLTQEKFLSILFDALSPDVADALRSIVKADSADFQSQNSNVSKELINKFIDEFIIVVMSENNAVNYEKKQQLIFYLSSAINLNLSEAVKNLAAKLDPILLSSLTMENFEITSAKFKAGGFQPQLMLEVLTTIPAYQVYVEKEIQNNSAFGISVHTGLLVRGINALNNQNSESLEQQVYNETLIKIIGKLQIQNLDFPDSVTKSNDWHHVLQGANNLLELAIIKSNALSVLFYDSASVIQIREAMQNPALMQHTEQLLKLFTYKFGDLNNIEQADVKDICELLFNLVGAAPDYEFSKHEQTFIKQVVARLDDADLKNQYNKKLIALALQVKSLNDTGSILEILENLEENTDPKFKFANNITINIDAFGVAFSEYDHYLAQQRNYNAEKSKALDKFFEALDPNIPAHFKILEGIYTKLLSFPNNNFLADKQEAATNLSKRFAKINLICQQSSSLAIAFLNFAERSFEQERSRQDDDAYKPIIKFGPLDNIVTHAAFNNIAVTPEQKKYFYERMLSEDAYFRYAEISALLATGKGIFNSNESFWDELQTLDPSLVDRFQEKIPKLFIEIYTNIIQKYQDSIEDDDAPSLEQRLADHHNILLRIIENLPNDTKHKKLLEKLFQTLLSSPTKDVSSALSDAYNSIILSKQEPLYSELIDPKLELNIVLTTSQVKLNPAIEIFRQKLKSYSKKNDFDNVVLNMTSPAIMPKKDLIAMLPLIQNLNGAYEKEYDRVAKKQKGTASSSFVKFYSKFSSIASGIKITKSHIDPRYKNYISFLKLQNFGYHQNGSENNLGPVLADQSEMLLAVVQASGYAIYKYASSNSVISENARQMFISCLLQMYKDVFKTGAVVSQEQVIYLAKAFEYLQEFKIGNQYPLVGLLESLEQNRSEIKLLDVFERQREFPLTANIRQKTTKQDAIMQSYADFINRSRNTFGPN